MELSEAVGPLSGKTTFAVLVWLIVWVGLHLRWRDQNVSFRAVYVVTLVLVGVGFVLTFPPVFNTRRKPISARAAHRGWTGATRTSQNSVMTEFAEFTF